MAAYGHEQPFMWINPESSALNDQLGQYSIAGLS